MKIKILFIFLFFSLLCLSKTWAVNYNLDNLRDPFESLLPTNLERATDSAPPDLLVTGLVWGSDKPTAIINDKVVRVGEEINGAKVIEITKDGVTVIFKGKLYELRPKKNLQ